eukprot:2787987-Lingulodinium_polyedra.AAC.1
MQSKLSAFRSTYGKGLPATSRPEAKYKFMPKLTQLHAFPGHLQCSQLRRELRRDIALAKAAPAVAARAAAPLPA